MARPLKPLRRVSRAVSNAPVKIVCAPNALKGTLSASDAARAIAAGVRRVLPSAAVLEVPIADGGDGTARLILEALGGAQRLVPALDPLGRARPAPFGLLDDGKTLVVDVASASGLALLAREERDARKASSFGTGELLRAGLETGARKVILGVGGSATVDGGAGLLRALGVRFYDACGEELPPGGAALTELATIDLSQLAPGVREAEFTIACDVENALLGPAGAAPVFGPQKGASAGDVVELEKGLERLAQVLEATTGRDVRSLRYGGAAGGIAASLHALLGARLTSGIDLVLDLVGFDELARGADLVLTAEGALDRSSLGHKGPVGVARRAGRFGVPAVALVGSLDPGIAMSDTPFVRVIPVSPPGTSETEQRAHAYRWVELAAARAVQPLRTGGGP